PRRRQTTKSAATATAGPAESTAAACSAADHACYTGDAGKEVALRRSGGIGRHTILRGWRREACGFESRLRHSLEIRNGRGSRVSGDDAFILVIHSISANNYRSRPYSLLS